MARTSADIVKEKSQGNATIQMLAHRHFAIFALRHGLPFTPGHELRLGCPVKERWERNLLTLCFSFGGLICLEIIFIISFHKYV